MNGKYFITNIYYTYGVNYTISIFMNSYIHFKQKFNARLLMHETISIRYRARWIKIQIYKKNFYE